MTRSQFDSLAEELAGLLKWDPMVLKAYTFLLSKMGEVMKEELASGMALRDDEATSLMAELNRGGLIINGSQGGFYPVHPRLGISNVYRLSIAKDPSVRLLRPKVDSLMSILSSYRDRVEDRRFAEPPKEGEPDV
ncbi:MAG TPA: hypothetical protein VMS77_09775 [Conexivisphaerales archaeon]|nr:hypothetical protein [Conexivisphaerales archaeon]